MASESGPEDELTSPSFRITPDSAARRSNLKRDASDAVDGSENSTPINKLRRLAAQSVNTRDAQTLSSSPFRAPSSIASSVGSRLADRTSNILQNARNLSRAVGRRPLPNTSTRLSSGVPTTPHAIRAMEERRRVVMTPSREKRRASGRGLERGSPFNILRSLSQVIAAPAPETITEQDEEEEEEDELSSPPIVNPAEQQVSDDSDTSDGVSRPPRMSLSMNEMQIEDDDDTGIFRPPEISRLDDDGDFTIKSVELGRRAEVDATILLGRRSRGSDLFGPVDAGKPTADDLTIRQPASPSFAAGDQSLFAGLATNDDTVNLQNSQQGDTGSPARGVREVDFADSTFRFDIPQDTTEASLLRDDATDEEVSQDENEAADNAAVLVQDVDDGDYSGPEDFGSPSEAEDIADEVEADADIGEFMEDAEEDDQPREDQEDPEIAISRELESQIRADEANLQRQTRPIIRLKPSSRESTEIDLELEPEEETAATLLVPQRTAVRRVPLNPKTANIPPRKRVPKPVVTSKLGHKVPSLPAHVVKSLADSFLPHSGKTSKKTKADTVKALSQATDWYFEQIAQDLDAYSNHADRDVIEESDVVALMKRQRVLGTGATNIQGNRSAAPGSSKATVFSLAQRFLPRELLTELRMDPPPDGKRHAKRRRISEGGELI